jgi:transposase
MRWLMRVPETLADAKALVKETDRAAMTPLEVGYWGKEVQSEYGGIEQRWLVVFSQVGYDRELKTLERAQEREWEAVEKAWRKVCQPTFNCEADAEKAATQFNQRWNYHQVMAQVTPITQYARRGRPAAEDEPEVVGYSLKGDILEHQAGIDEARRSLGKFILATNEVDTERLPAGELLANYTDQGVTVERGFRFLKDPLFFADSLFLKKPERIMALIMIMGLALLVYALAERQLRLALEQKHETIPDQKGKPTQKPTLRWVFQVFEGVDILSVWIWVEEVLCQDLNLRPVHLQVLRLFGPQIEKCYLIAT